MMAVRLAAALLGTLLLPALSACTYFEPREVVTPGPGDASKLAQMMNGRFVSAPNANGDRINEFRMSIEPLGPGEWVYFQRNLGPKRRTERRMHQQQVLQLVNRPGGGVEQVAWLLKAPELYRAAPRHPGLLKSLTKKSIKPSSDTGCEKLWVNSMAPVAGSAESVPSWEGTIDPDRCSIYWEKENRQIAFGAMTRLTGNRLLDAERGYGSDRSQLWGTPPGQFTEMVRVRTN